jgi:type I restriction enzyme R subunit
MDYAEFLVKLLDLTAQVGKGDSETKYPDWASTSARRALVDFDWSAGVDVQYIYGVIQNGKEHGWVETKIKERALARALRSELPEGFEVDRLEQLINLLKVHDEYR